MNMSYGASNVGVARSTSPAMKTSCGYCSAASVNSRSFATDIVRLRHLLPQKGRTQLLSEEHEAISFRNDSFGHRKCRAMYPA